MTIRATYTTDPGSEEAIGRVGLPSRHRYNYFVSQSVDSLKLGGKTEAAQVWAMLAQAEAQILCEPDA